MQVFSKRVRQPIEKLTDDIDVAIFSQDGEYASVIVESDLRLVRVFVVGEPDFADKAKSYGFKSPVVESLGTR